MRRSHVASFATRLTVAAILTGSVCFAALASAEQAAPADPATASSPATASDPGALRAEGLALIYGQGGQTADVAGGVALLERAVAAGDARARAELGGMLVDGYYVPPDPARGVALLEEAVAQGDTRAMAALGGALLWGRAAPADPVRARALLQQAVDAGDAGARSLLGEQLVGGWVLPRDVPAGRALLEAGVAAGEVKAETALSGLLLYGIGLDKDPAQARALAEAAAERGSSKALRQVGEMLMWGQSAPAEAEALLTRAGEMGDGAAWAILAEGAMYGYLEGGGAASRAKFDGFAAKARAAGNERIEVLDATRQMWGINMVASGPKTLERLETAAAAGNALAAQNLVVLLRDGNQMNLWPDRDAAAAALARHAAVLGPDASWRLERTIEAARARQPAAWAAVAKAVAERPDLASKEFGQDLYKANPNVAVYVLQRKLADAGLYAGRPNGLATHDTLRALYKACRKLPDDPACGDSVMRPDILGAIFAAQ